MGAARRHHRQHHSQLLGDDKKELLDRLASECLEHTKQLGLFDQLRMRLLDSIVASNEFQKLKSEFKRELDTFCSQADLSESRSKLRERLTTKTLPNSASRLKELVVDKLTSSRRQRHEMLQLYAEQALKYIHGACLANQNKQAEEGKEVDEGVIEETSTKIDEQPPSSGSSSDSLATDSGVSSSGGGSSCSPVGPPAAATAPPTTAPTSPIPAKVLLRNYHIPKLEKKPIDSPVDAKKPSTPPPPLTTTTTASSNPFSQKKSAGSGVDRWRRNRKKKKKKKKSRRQRMRAEEERRDARTTRPTRSRSPQRPRLTSSTKHITTQRVPIKVI